MRFVADRIKSLDTLGEEFSMTYQGRGRHSTVFGGISSSIILLILFGVFLKLASDYVRTDDPDIRQNFVVSNNYPLMDLYNYRFAYAFTLNSEKSIMYVEDLPNYITPFARVVKATKSATNPTDKKITNTETFIPFVPCKKLKDPLNSVFLANDVDSYISQNAICMNITKPGEYFVNASISTYPHTYLDILIYPCSSDDFCYGADEYSVLKLIANKIVTAFDPSNKTQPLTNFIDSDEIYAFDIANGLDIFSVLKMVEINDDDIDFMGSQKKFDYLEIDKT